MDAKQFLLRCLLTMLLIAFVVHLLGKPFLAGLCGGFVLAVWLPIKTLNFKIARAQKKFLTLFPDAIDLIVRGLRSGLPVSESINLVAQEVPEPVSGIFTHISNTMKLGVPMEKAMQEVAKKLDYTEFNFFVTSIILQRETGGNLSEILNNLGEVLRKRLMMRLKIKAMTSEARASSMIIGSLPFIVTIAVSVMSPDYIKPLFNDYRGNYAAFTAAGLLFLGIWSMNRMAKFEI
jgi:tight adherence protein B